MSQPSAIDPIASLRERGFLIYLVGSLVSNVGNQMRTTAVGWEVYQRTDQPLSLGIVGLVLALPVILFALPAGAAADRYSRRAIIMLGQAGMAASGLGLAWASATHAPIFWTYVFLFCSGVARALGWPAATAIVPSLVPPRVFPNAAMWRSVGFQLSATLGPLAGGLLLASYSPTVVYGLDAASSVVQILALTMVRPRAQERRAEPSSWSSLIEGIRFLARRPVILSTMVLDMVAVLFGGATALLPIYARDIIHLEATYRDVDFGTMPAMPSLGAVGIGTVLPFCAHHLALIDPASRELAYGWLRAMPPIGAIVMSLWLATRPPFRQAGRTLLAVVVVFGVATIVFGVSRSFPVSLAALFVLGAADNISVVIRATVLQLMTPDNMRGRVTAVSIIFIGTSNEIGEFESGVVSQMLQPWAGSPLNTMLTVAGGGVATLLTVVWVAWQWPVLMTLGRLDELQPPEPVEEAVS
jgi:MFS family permease